MIRIKLPVALVIVCSGLLIAGIASAQDTATEEQETTEVKLAGGSMIMQAPASWKVVEPKFSMIEAEFSIPKVEEDEAESDGRLTIMAAGGSIDANIDRWMGQFSQPDGSSSSDEATVEETEIAGMTVHIVDVSGTFADRPRPAAPPTLRDDYRMLAAIIETGGDGNYFIKFYGGKPTVDANMEMFHRFLLSLKTE